MDFFKENIDRQIDSNKGKNLFNIDSLESMRFIDDTIRSIHEVSSLDHETENFLIDYATDKCLHEFCRINQYFSFNSEAKEQLRSIYRELFSAIKNRNESVEIISENHYTRLKDWLTKTNPFAENIYSGKEDIIQPITCSEYSANFQFEILHLNVSDILEPVLDIGCGSQGNLITYLRGNGIEAYGIDRLAQNEPYLHAADWLEYNYSAQEWGTIVSNLGFSNHFNHHHLRNSGNFMEYALKYMQILNSLKVGGKFHYAPSLSFIEQYLDSTVFRIERHRITSSNFESTIITRIK